MLASAIKNCKTKNFPPFIRNSSGLTSLNKIEKVFPSIGLPNCKEDIDVKLDFSNVALDKVIHLAIKRYISQFKDKNFHGDLKGLELFKVSKILYVLEDLDKRFNKAVGLNISNSSVRLSTPIPSYDGKPLFKTGTDVFKLVKALLLSGAKYAKVDLVNNEEIAKECKNLQIIFSSEDIDGAWDLATMSMRGIKSCMRWDARQARALVGSITDSCCGVIYLTNGSKTQYGSKMLFRSLVRLVVDTSEKPALVVDRLYSSFYKNKPDECNNLDNQVRELFINFLRKKLPGCTILDAAKDKGILTKYCLPLPNNFSYLTEEERSYRDTYIGYTTNSYDRLAANIVKNFNTNIQKPEKKTRVSSRKKTPRKK
jgi:hypothetical protein